MAKASDNLFPYVHLVPAVAPASPAAGAQRLFLDSADSNKLKRKDSTGTVTAVEGSGGGGAPAAHASTHAAAGTDPVSLDDSQVAPLAPNDQTGTTYTFVLADGRKLVTASNAAAQTYTVPPNSSVAYPLGTVLSIVQKGAGQVTLAQGAGVTLQSAHGLKTSVQWAVVSLTKILTDTWVVSGDTTT